MAKKINPTAFHTPKEMQTFLQLVNKESCLLFDTETTSLLNKTGSSLEEGAQIWEFGGILLKSGTNSSVPIHYFIESKRNKEEIPDDEEMMVYDTFVHTKDFFFGDAESGITLAKLQAEHPDVQTIREEELIPILHSMLHLSKDTAYGGYNIAFDSAVLNSIARKYGQVLVDKSNCFDFQALVLDVLPILQQESTKSILKTVAEYAATDGEYGENNKFVQLISALQKLNPDLANEFKELLEGSDEYRENELYLRKQHTSKDKPETLKAIMDRAAAKGVPVDIQLDLIDTGKNKHGAQRYNLDKIRAMCASQAIISSAIYFTNDVLGLGIDNSRIQSCVKEIQSLVNEYGLKSREQHDAFQDTVQMIGVGSILIKISRLFGIYSTSKHTLENVLGVFIGYEQGKHNISSVMVNTADELAKQSSFFGRPGMISGVKIKSSGVLSKEEQKLIREYRESLLTNQARAHVLELEYNKLESAKHKRFVYELCVTLTDQEIKLIQNKKLRDEIRRAKQSKGFASYQADLSESQRRQSEENAKYREYNLKHTVDSNLQSKFKAAVESLLSAQSVNRYLCTSTRTVNEGLVSGNVNLVCKRIFELSKFYSDFAHRSSLWADCLNQSKKPVDYFGLKIYEIAESIFGKIPKENINQYKDLIQTGMRIALESSRKNDFSHFSGMSLNQLQDCVEAYKLLCLKHYECNKGQEKTIETKINNLDFKGIKLSCIVPPYSKEYTGQLIVQIAMLNDKNAKTSQSVYSSHSSVETRVEYVPDSAKEARAKQQIIDKVIDGLTKANNFRAEQSPTYDKDHTYDIYYMKGAKKGSKGKKVSVIKRDAHGNVSEYYVEFKGQRYDIISTTTLGKQKLGDKYSSFTNKTRLAILDKNIKDIDFLVDELLQKVEHDKPKTEKGTLVHAVIQQIETYAHTHTCDVYKLYNDVLGHRVGSLPKELKDSLYSEGVFGSGGIIAGWAGEDELQSWIALRQELKLPTNKGIKSEQPIVAMWTDDTTGKQYFITGSIDGIYINGKHSAQLLDFKNTAWISPDNPDWYFQLAVYSKIYTLQTGNKITSAKILALMPKHVDASFKEYVVAITDPTKGRVRLSYEEYLKQRGIITPTANENTPWDMSGTFIEEKTGKQVDNLIRINGKFVGTWVREYFKYTEYKEKINAIFKGQAEEYLNGLFSDAEFEKNFPKIPLRLRKVFADMYKECKTQITDIMSAFKQAWYDTRVLWSDRTGLAINGKDAVKIAISNYLERFGAGKVSAATFTGKDLDSFLDALGTEIVGAKGLTRISADDNIVSWYMIDSWTAESESEAEREAVRREEQKNIRLDSNQLRTLGDERQAVRDFETKAKEFIKIYTSFQNLLLNPNNKTNSKLFSLADVTLSQLRDSYNELVNIAGKEELLLHLLDEFTQSLFEGNFNKFSEAVNKQQDPELFAYNVQLYNKMKDMIFVGVDDFKHKLTELYPNSKQLPSKYGMAITKIIGVEEVGSIEKIAHVISSEIVRSSTMTDIFEKMAERRKKSVTEIINSLSVDGIEQYNDSIAFHRAYNRILRVFNTKMNAVTSGALPEGNAIQFQKEFLIDLIELCLVATMLPSSEMDAKDREQILSSLMDFSDESGESRLGFVDGFHIESLSSDTNQEIVNELNKIYKDLLMFRERIIAMTVSLDGAEINKLFTTIRVQVDTGRKFSYQTSKFSSMQLFNSRKNDSIPIELGISPLLFDMNIRKSDNTMDIRDLANSIIRRADISDRQHRDNSMTDTLLTDISQIVAELLRYDQINGGTNGRDAADYLIELIGLGGVGIMWNSDHTKIEYHQGSDVLVRAEEMVISFQRYHKTSDSLMAPKDYQIKEMLAELMKFKTSDDRMIKEKSKLLNDLQYYYFELEKDKLHDGDVRTFIQKIASTLRDNNLLPDVLNAFEYNGIKYDYNLLPTLDAQLSWIKYVHDYLVSHGLELTSIIGADKYNQLISFISSNYSIYNSKYLEIVNQQNKLKRPVARGDSVSSSDKGNASSTEGSRTVADGVFNSNAGNMNVSNLNVGNVTIQNVQIKGQIVKDGDTSTGSNNPVAKEAGEPDDPRFKFADPSKVNKTTTYHDWGTNYGRATITETGLNEFGDTITRTRDHSARLEDGKWAINTDTFLSSQYKLSEKGGVGEEEKIRLLDEYKEKLTEVANYQNDIDIKTARASTLSAKGREEEANKIREEVAELERLKQATTDSAAVTESSLNAEDALRIKNQVSADSKLARLKAEMRITQEERAQKEQAAKSYEDLIKRQTELLKERQKLERQNDLTSNLNVTTKRGIKEQAAKIDENLAALQPQIDAAKGNVSQKDQDRILAQQAQTLEDAQRKQRLYAGGALNLWQGMQQAMYNTIKSMTGISLAYRIIGKVRQSITQVIQYAKELDQTMVNLRIVTGGTADETKTLMSGYAKLGKELGATTTEVAKSANEWLRQGYAVNEVNSLITSSMYLSKLGMMSSEEATKSLTSALKGFHLAATDSLEVVDKLTKVDMNAAASAGDIASMLRNYASTATLAGLDIDQAIAMGTTVLDVSQKDSGSVGNAFNFWTHVGIIHKLTLKNFL